ncbi:hypothetical protein RhiirA1_467170 [Rhizophagus irregularis]|uniref:Uncharacterized protein n=1 Tax=Rhizophagus irregularis TaxID=588596 RepID=A0A2N0RCK2_9GLOM|nr:hypothetical protein RhiirA1_467170 [Rhizophagus irregularis]
MEIKETKIAENFGRVIQPVQETQVDQEDADPVTDNPVVQAAELVPEEPPVTKEKPALKEQPAPKKTHRQYLGEFYGKEMMILCEKFSPLVDKFELKKEWGYVKFYLQSYKIQEFKFRECWKHIFDTDSNIIINFPISQIGLIIPLSNANVKRIFSQ